MANYTEEEIQAKRQALRSRSIRAYSETQTLALLYSTTISQIQGKINNAKMDLKKNPTGIYSDPNQFTRKVYRKELEEIIRDLEDKEKIYKKALDDLTRLI